MITVILRNRYWLEIESDVAELKTKYNETLAEFMFCDGYYPEIDVRVFSYTSISTLLECKKEIDKYRKASNK